MHIKRWALSAFTVLQLSNAVLIEAQDTEPPIRFPRAELHLLEELTARNPAALSSVTLDEDANVASVYVVGGRQKEAIGLVRTKAEGLNKAEDSDLATIRFVDVEHSWEALSSFHEKTLEHTRWFSDLGIELVRWYVDPYSNSVRIGVSKVTRELQERARKTWGSKVTLEVATESHSSFSRDADEEAFAGGAKIKGPRSGGTANCSLGFAMEKTSGTAEPWKILTAGHCFDNGATIRTSGNSLVVGTVSNTLVAEGLDRGIISGKNYWDEIYIGGITSSQLRNVMGTTSPVVGQSNICVGGAATGESCGWKVLIKNSCALVSGQRQCYVDTIGHLNTATATAEGDSGGPVYVYTNFYMPLVQLLGIGVIIAHGDTLFGLPVPQQYNTTSYHTLQNLFPTGWGLAHR